MTNIQVFVSHSHADREIAKRLVGLIEASFLVPAGSVRCSSVPGYTLSLGDNIADKIGAELQSAVCVIALITPSSLRSPWVLIELGAAWSHSKRLVPLLIGNVDTLLSGMPSPLTSPLSGDISQPGTLFQLIDLLSHLVQWQRRPVEQTYEALSNLAQYAAQVNQSASTETSASEIDVSGRLVRTDPRFTPLRQFSEGGKDILIAALSHGYLLAEGLSAVKERLLSGCDIKLIIVDPYLPDDCLKIIAEHDERSAIQPNFHQFLQFEITSVISTLSGLSGSLPRQGGRGSLEIRAARGIPVFTITIVDPDSIEHGRMLLELRPYHRNDGPRPWFDLRKNRPSDRVWFDALYDDYYIKLWGDSRTLARV